MVKLLSLLSSANSSIIQASVAVLGTGTTNVDSVEQSTYVFIYNQCWPWRINLFKEFISEKTHIPTQHNKIGISANQLHEIKESYHQFPCYTTLVIQRIWFYCTYIGHVTTQHYAGESSFIHS